MTGPRGVLLLGTSGLLHAAAVGAALILTGVLVPTPLFVDLVREDAASETRAPDPPPSAPRRIPSAPTVAARAPRTQAPKADTPRPALSAPAPLEEPPRVERAEPPVEAPLSALVPPVSLASPPIEPPPSAAAPITTPHPTAPPPVTSGEPARAAASVSRPSPSPATGSDTGVPSSTGSAGGVFSAEATRRGSAAGGGAGPPVALAPAREGGGAVPPEYGPYLRRFRERLQQSLRYPLAARRQHVTGTVELEVLLEPTGKVRAVEVVSSSSSAVLDEAAVDAVRNLPPIPLPEHLPRRPLRIRLPLLFDLR